MVGGNGLPAAHPNTFGSVLALAQPLIVVCILVSLPCPMLSAAPPVCTVPQRSSSPQYTVYLYRRMDPTCAEPEERLCSSSLPVSRDPTALSPRLPVTRINPKAPSQVSFTPSYEYTALYAPKPTPQPKPKHPPTPADPEPLSNPEPVQKPRIEPTAQQSPAFVQAPKPSSYPEHQPQRKTRTLSPSQAGTPSDLSRLRASPLRPRSGSTGPSPAPEPMLLPQPRPRPKTGQKSVLRRRNSGSREQRAPSRAIRIEVRHLVAPPRTAGPPRMVPMPLQERTKTEFMNVFGAQPAPQTGGHLQMVTESLTPRSSVESTHPQPKPATPQGPTPIPVPSPVAPRAPEPEPEPKPVVLLKRPPSVLRRSLVPDPKPSPRPSSSRSSSQSSSVSSASPASAPKPAPKPKPKPKAQPKEQPQPAAKPAAPKPKPKAAAVPLAVSKPKPKPNPEPHIAKPRPVTPEPQHRPTLQLHSKPAAVVEPLSESVMPEPEVAADLMQPTPASAIDLPLAADSAPARQPAAKPEPKPVAQAKPIPKAHSIRATDAPPRTKSLGPKPSTSPSKGNLPKPKPEAKPVAKPKPTAIAKPKPEPKPKPSLPKPMPKSERQLRPQPEAAPEPETMAEPMAIPAIKPPKPEGAAHPSRQATKKPQAKPTSSDSLSPRGIPCSSCPAVTVALYHDWPSVFLTRDHSETAKCMDQTAVFISFRKTILSDLLPKLGDGAVDGCWFMEFAHGGCPWWFCLGQIISLVMYNPL